MTDLDILNKINNSSLISLSGTTQHENVVSIKLDDIMTFDQVRTEGNDGFNEGDLGTDDDSVNDSLTALAASIRRNGLKCPIIVRQSHIDNDFSKPVIDGKFTVVCGERRFRATKLIRQWQDAEKANGSFDEKEPLVDSILAIVRQYDDDNIVLIDQLTENVQRTELTTLEIGMSLKKLVAYLEKKYPEKVVEKNINGENVRLLDRQFIGDYLSKSKYWVQQMLSYAELDPIADRNLIEYFNNGVVSKDSRAGYNLIRLYQKDKEFVLEQLEYNKIYGNTVDRRKIKEIGELLERKLKGDDGTSDEELPNLRMSEIGDDNDEPDFDEEDLANAEESSDEGRDSDPDHDGSEESSDPSSEYSESNEKERKAKPSMAPKHQKNDAPTAGVNATSSYTDADTKVGHDLSDSIRDEPAADESEDEEEVVVKFKNDAGTEQSGKVALSTLRTTFVDLVLDDGTWVKVSLDQLVNL